MIALALTLTLTTPPIEAVLHAEYINAIIVVESDWDPRAVSRSGAMGLMQIMPGTWEEWGVGDPFDPAANIACGVRYMLWLLARPVINYDLDKALAAYNWGIGRMTRLLEAHPADWREHLPQETRQYLDKINKEIGD